MNSLVLGRFFTRVPDFSGSGPVWIRELKLMCVGTSMNSVIALHNLKLEDAPVESLQTAYWSALSTFLAQDSETARTRAQFILDYRCLRSTANTVSQKLSADILNEFWKRNPVPFIACKADEATEEKSTLQEPGNISRNNRKEIESETSGISESAYQLAAKYVVLQYSAFIGYAMRHLQNLLLCSILCFVFLVLALNSYSFQSPQSISRLLTISLIVAGVIVTRILAQIERDPILSRMSGTEEGTLGKDFYFRVLAFGALPVLTVLSSKFPSIAHFVSLWAQPTVEAIR